MVLDSGLELQCCFGGTGLSWALAGGWPYGQCLVDALNLGTKQQLVLWKELLGRHIPKGFVSVCAFVTSGLGSHA